MAVDYGKMTDDEIIAAYKARFGGDVSAIAGDTESGIDAAALYDNMVKWYDGFSKKNGRSPSEQEWIGAAQAYGGISSQAAKALYDKGANYVKTTGQRATPEEWGQWLAKETRIPNEDRRRWDTSFEEQKRRADEAKARDDEAAALTREKEATRQREKAAQVEFDKAKEETRRLEDEARQTGYTGGRPTLAREMEEARQREATAQAEFNKAKEETRQQEELTRQTGYVGGNATLARTEAEARIAAEQERLKQANTEMMGYLDSPDGQRLPTLDRQRIEADIRQNDEKIKQAAQSQSGWIDGPGGRQATLARTEAEARIAAEQERLKQAGEAQSGWIDGPGGQQATLDRTRMETDLFRDLSGAQDWVKYQIAQSGMPEGSLGEGGLADVFARQSAFGAVTPDPSNSWEGKFDKMWQDRNRPTQTGGPGGPGAERQTVGPGAGGPMPQEGPPQMLAGGGQALPWQPQGEGDQQRDIAYNDALRAAGKRTEDFVRAPANWKPGMPVQQPGGFTGQPYGGPWQPSGQGQGIERQSGRTGPTGQMEQRGQVQPGTMSPDEQARHKAYNDALMAAGKRTEDFRYAPQGWRPGMPVNIGAAPSPTGQMEQPLPQDPSVWGRDILRKADLPAYYQQAAQPQPQPAQPGQPRTTMNLAQQLGRRQPTSIGAIELNKMTPTQKKMQSGAWSAAGLDIDDMWEKTRRAQPQGRAATTTRWA